MNTILLCLSQSDLRNLPNAANALKKIGTQNVWLVYSPAVTVNVADATAQFDREIADLQSAKDAAAKREDFTGASSLKLQIEGKQLDRKQAIGDAWKRVAKEDRKKAATALFQPFYEACGKDLAPIPYETEEHHDAAELHNILNLYKGVNPFGTGNYGVVFSRAIGKSASISLDEAAKSALERIPAPAQKPAKDKFDATRTFSPAELEKLPHFSLMSVGKHHKVWAQGIPKPELIKSILGKSAAPVAV